MAGLVCKLSHTVLKSSLTHNTALHLLFTILFMSEQTYSQHYVQNVLSISACVLTQNDK